MVRHAVALLALAGAAGLGEAEAQDSGALTMERARYAEWLATAPTSPMAAVAMRRIGPGVTLGPDTADIPLAGFGPAIVSERRGAVTLSGPGHASRPLPRGRPVPVKPWTLQVLGGAGQGVLIVFGPSAGGESGWYPVNQGAAFTLPLEPPASRDRRRVLTLDGIDVEAELAGFLTVPLGSAPTRLQVMRMPIPGTEETELQVYFRDRTNDHGTYPAGRFVEVTAAGGNQYRIDFNRARNPFCAYSTVYPCPVPWAGNSIPAAVEAGEKYLPLKPES